MGWSLEEAKQRLGDNAFEQVRQQLNKDKKKQKPVSKKISVQKQRSPAEIALEFLAKIVFEPDYRVESEVKLVLNRDFSCDFFIRDLGLILEVDGWQYHGKHLKDFKRDREKDYLLLIEGFTVLRIEASVALSKQEEAILRLKAAKKEMERRLGYGLNIS